MQSDPLQRTSKALTRWQALVSRARQEMPVDLSMRQHAILLAVYLEEAPPSVKSLAEELHISKPAICRALDMLERNKLVKRVRDKKDKRMVWVTRTMRGSVFMSEFAEIVRDVF
jgi:DNA-binding MarR family transcriptional regulator